MDRFHRSELIVCERHRLFNHRLKKTIVSERGDVKHNDVLEKNEVQCFQACVDLILSMRGFLTDGRAY